MPENFTEYARYIAVLLGWLAGVPLLWRTRSQLKIGPPWQIGLLGLGFSAVSVAAAVVFAGLESLIGGQGFDLGAISTYGVYILAPAGIALIALVSRKDMGAVFDAFALYAIPSLFILRCDCLLSGCCAGRTIGTTGYTWPTRQAEMIFYVVMFLLLLRRERQGARRGTAFPLLMASYGAFRFVDEWFRSSESENLIHMAHIWSVMVFIIGFGLYSELLSGRPQTKRAALGKERF